MSGATPSHRESAIPIGHDAAALRTPEPTTSTDALTDLADQTELFLGEMLELSGERPLSRKMKTLQRVCELDRRSRVWRVDVGRNIFAGPIQIILPGGGVVRSSSEGSEEPTVELSKDDLTRLISKLRWFPEEVLLAGLPMSTERWLSLGKSVSSDCVSEREPEDIDLLYDFLWAAHAYSIRIQELLLWAGYTKRIQIRNHRGGKSVRMWLTAPPHPADDGGAVISVAQKGIRDFSFSVQQRFVRSEEGEEAVTITSFVLDHLNADGNPDWTFFVSNDGGRSQVEITSSRGDGRYTFFSARSKPDNAVRLMQQVWSGMVRQFMVPSREMVSSI